MTRLQTETTQPIGYAKSLQIQQFAMWPWFNGVRHVAVVQQCSPCGRGSAVFAMWLWFNGVRHVAVAQRCSPCGCGLTVFAMWPWFSGVRPREAGPGEHKSVVENYAYM